MKRAAATIVREYGPFPGVANVAGVSYDGSNVWIAAGDTLNAIDPASGKTMRTLDVPAHAGTALCPLLKTERSAWLRKRSRPSASSTSRTVRGRRSS